MNLEKLFLMLKGSYTSGNWGHEGNPPHHGGSSPGGGLKKIGISSDDSSKNVKIHLRKSKQPAEKKEPEKKPVEKKQPEKKAAEKKSEKKAEEGKKFTEATEKEMSDHYSSYNESCKSKGCKALKLYSENSETPNNHLRHGKPAPASYKKAIKEIDEEMENGPRVPKDTVVHRVVSNGFFNSGVFEKGLEFQDKGFVSTSISKDGTPGTPNLEIRVPKGATCLGILNSE